jgi:hypothetical protein
VYATAVAIAVAYTNVARHRKFGGWDQADGAPQQRRTVMLYATDMALSVAYRIAVRL